MAAQTKRQDGGHDADAACNEVRLVGRLGAPAEEKELPSGAVVVQFRVVVGRPPGPERVPRRPSVDTLDCTVWTGRAKRSALTWRAGDVVEVTGSMRRRFFRTVAGTASRVEVEVASGRVVRRAPRPAATG
jgi:single-strand DNA-binding protein